MQINEADFFTMMFAGQKLTAEQVGKAAKLPENAPFTEVLLVKHRRLLGSTFQITTRPRIVPFFRTLTSQPTTTAKLKLLLKAEIDDQLSNILV